MSTPEAATGYTAGATYFGHASPFNVWSSDLSQAPRDFQRIRTDGFNTVALVLPWGQFEPGLRPPRFDESAFARLTTLIREAGDAGLNVALRLGYPYDVSPGEELPWGARLQAMFSDEALYQDWLGYINEVHRRVAGFHNVRSAFITWEDLWTYVESARALTDPAARLDYARATGFQTWLGQAHNLSDVNSLYRQSFPGYDQVPIPLAQTPAFKLVFEYFQYLLVHKFFEPAAKRFPGLTMETRVDEDPIFDGTRTVGAFTYSDLYQLPGTTVTGMYWSPYMGSTVASGQETAAQAVQALQSVLTKMKARSANRPLVIYEYEIVSNAPQIAGTTTIASAQLPAFVEQSGPVLQGLTSGYLLWTYRDFNTTAVFNPSFSLGLTGWQARGTTTLTTAPDGEAAIELGSGSSISQSIPGEFNPFSGTGKVSVSFRAAAASAAAQVIVTIGGRDRHTVTVGPGWSSYSFQLPTTGLSTWDLSFQASANVAMTNIEEYSFTQLGSVYRPDWTPEEAQPALQRLNMSLLHPAS